MREKPCVAQQFPHTLAAVYATGQLSHRWHAAAYACRPCSNQ